MKRVFFLLAFFALLINVGISQDFLFNKALSIPYDGIEVGPNSIASFPKDAVNLMEGIVYIHRVSSMPKDKVITPLGVVSWLGPGCFVVRVEKSGKDRVTVYSLVGSAELETQSGRVVTIPENRVGVIVTNKDIELTPLKDFADIGQIDKEYAQFLEGLGDSDSRSPEDINTENPRKQGLEHDERKELADSKGKTTKELVLAADYVLEAAKKNAVVAAKDSATIFLAAQRLFEEGDLVESEVYYQKGLALAPWSIQAQLSYAHVLSGLKKFKKASDVARVVQMTTESDLAYTKACEILGVPTEQLETLPDTTFNEKVICLVPLGGVEDFLLTKIGNNLSQTLGVDVYLYPQVLDLPEPTRSSFDVWFSKAKKELALLLESKNPWVEAQLEEVGISNLEDASNDQVLELMVRIDRGDGSAKSLVGIEEMVFRLKMMGNQWDSTFLLTVLEEGVPAQKNVIYLGITEADLFSPDTNYVFGTAWDNSNYALISYHRYLSSFNEETENQKRLLARIQKQGLSSLGFALGVPRPTDPRSARSYPKSLQEHDAKGLWLSPSCIEGFEKALGRPLPTKTKEESREGMGG